MSRDSSRTYIHLHWPHHADIFEEFTSPPPATPGTTHSPADFANQPSSTRHPTAPSTTAPSSSHPQPAHTATLTLSSNLNASTHIPPEDIFVPPHHLPPNPEDEDDVVPDQHAAFGIARAMATVGGRGERAWRDFEGLEEVVRGVGVGEDVWGGRGNGVGAVAHGRSGGAGSRV